MSNTPDDRDKPKKGGKFKPLGLPYRINGIPKTRKITKKLAQEWVDMTAAPGDRPLNPHRYEFYKRCILEMEMRSPVDWAKVFCRENETWYRVNGKHTSAACASLSNDDLSEMYATIAEYTCDKMEGVAALYATFDSKIQSRNMTDVNKSYAACRGELADIHIRSINLAVAALGFFKNPKKPYTGEMKDRAELVYDHIPVTLWLTVIAPYKNKAAKIIFRMPVAAAMIATYYVDSDKATEFWTLVKNRLGDSVTRPYLVLSQFLADHRLEGSPNSRSMSLTDRASPLEIYAKCIYAWNAWRRGDGLTQLRYSPGDPPEAK